MIARVRHSRLLPSEAGTLRHVERGAAGCPAALFVKLVWPNTPLALVTVLSMGSESQISRRW